MREYPETPSGVETAGFSGHVWIQELPTGGEFRFQVAPSGFVTFATADGTVDSAAAVPAPFRRAAHQIDEQLDRDALLAGTDAPGEITFCGLATRNEGIEYDWGTVPPFVGTEVLTERTLPPDAATGVFERLGLPTLPAIEKERPAAHTDFDRFDDPTRAPESAWRDGPVAGVLIRDKAGHRASVRCVEPADSGTTQRTSSELAATYATPERIERTVERMRADGNTLSVAGIRDRLVADVAREAYADLFADGTFAASVAEFESAVAQRVQRQQFTGDQ